ncbi:MAG: hypothetical protein K8W52_34155 [Deltaproteobacteria bacterium]|nr:hypothetical protein [Deltaproteobacteria bacterium]
MSTMGAIRLTRKMVEEAKQRASNPFGLGDEVDPLSIPFVPPWADTSPLDWTEEPAPSVPDIWTTEGPDPAPSPFPWLEPEPVPGGTYPCTEPPMPAPSPGGFPCTQPWPEPAPGGFPCTTPAPDWLGAFDFLL